jgi:hypothetical protein
VASALLGSADVVHAQRAPVQLVLIDSLKVRPVFQKLWDESVEMGKELVACIGGDQQDGTFKIRRAADLRSLMSQRFDSDSVSISLHGSQLSVDICKPPGWSGTIHTHRMEGGVEFPKLSARDRAVISLWHERWRRDSVFCVMFSRIKPPYCEYHAGISEDSLSEDPEQPAPPGPAPKARAD